MEKIKLLDRKIDTDMKDTYGKLKSVNKPKKQLCSSLFNVHAGIS